MRIEVFRWLGIMVAGAAGAAARYVLSGAIQRLFASEFPWGTWLVNITGCFLFGVVWSLAMDRMVIPPAWRTVLLVGFLGSFTTFSTFVYESEQLLEHAQWGAALLNMAGELAGGLAAYALGVGLARWI